MWPSDNYILRFDRTLRPLTRNNVLDLVVTRDFQTVALTRWDGGNPATSGFTLTRIDRLGAIVWQTPVTPCGPAPGDCRGYLSLEAGALATTPDGFLFAGVILDRTNTVSIVTAGFDDGGTLLWMRSNFLAGYTPGDEPPRAGIVPLAMSDRYLVAVSVPGWTTTWFFTIDSSGVFFSPGVRVRTENLGRLRATATHGIFAIGSRILPVGSGGWMLNLDPTSIRPSPVWQRIYDAPGPGIAVPRWLDIAEGAANLVAVGHTHNGFAELSEALVAGIDGGGGILWSKSPAFEQQLPRVEGIANLQFDPVPIAADAPPRDSRFVVCGTLERNWPWLFSIDDRGTVGWQKVFFTPETPATLEHLVWPSLDDIVAGGGALSRDPLALVASSKSVARASGSYCSREVAPRFPDRPVTSRPEPIVTEDFGPTPQEWVWQAGFPQPPLLGCPE